MNCLEKDNIPAGYKDSAVGIIPQEWEVKPFKNLGTFLRTNTLSREHMNNVEGLALNIHYGDVLVRYGEILDCSKTAIPWVNNSCRETRLGDRLQNGDIVISDTAEDYTVGKATEVCNVGNNCVLSGLHTMAFRPPKETFALRYLGYYFNSPAYRAQLYSLIQGIKVCSISKSAISNTYIPVPPMGEQGKIAEILGVWDEAIEKQSRLIERLEVRKRALMQRLLTGRIRLSGFTSPWQKIKLGEIGKTYNGLTGKSKEDFEDGNAKFIPYINVFLNEKVNIDKLGVVSVDESEKQNKVQYGDIFFTVSSETPDEVGMASVLLEYIDDTYLNSFCFGYRLNDFETLNPIFASYILRGDRFRNFMMVLAQGSTRFNISKNEVMKLRIELPSLPEQKAIAEVLTTADDEIAIHRKKLDALRLQKRGLMQQLLTGKTRVKI